MVSFMPQFRIFNMGGFFVLYIEVGSEVLKNN